MHAIIRKLNGRRREVDFEGVEISTFIHMGEDVVEIIVEGKVPFTALDKQPVAIMNIPREIFDAALREGSKFGYKHPGVVLKMVKDNE